MRILLALALLAACSNAPSDSVVAEEGTVVTYRVLGAAAYGAAANAEPGTAREARIAVASTPDAYRALWREHVEDTASPPAVDFARESAVFLLLGQRSTGGWSIEPESVSVRGNEVDVTAAIGRPEPGGMVTMAFSAPYAVIAVTEPGLEAATWKERDGSVVVTAPESPR